MPETFQTFQNILTITGQQKKAAAEAGGTPVNITHFKVGDSNGSYYNPLETQTDLVNTRYTGNFTDNSGSQILVNPSALNEVLYKCFIPADIGGFTVRELGLFDSENSLILICKLPAQDKFTLDAGLYQPLTFTPRIIYTNPQTQAVLTPSNQILATQTFVNEQINQVTQQITEISQQTDEKIIVHDNDSNAHTSIVNHFQSIVSEISTYPYTTYCANSGNTDLNGYPELINKESDTGVSFKVGGSCPNMGITFPNGKNYEISHIENVTGLNDNALYTFIIFEENLIKLEDGTYSALVTPIKVGYDAVQRLSALTSDSHVGFNAAYSGSLSFNPYDIFDNDSNTGVLYNQSVYIYDPAHFKPETSGYSTFTLTMDAAKNIEYLMIYSTSYFQPGWFNWDGYFVKIQTSTDGGTTWSAETTVNLTDSTKIDILQNINAIKFRFSFCTSAYSNENMNNMWYVRKYLNVSGIEIFEKITYAGGTITESWTLPAAPSTGDLALLINQYPLKPCLKESSSWIEKQFIKLGEVTKSGGLLATPISYAFNGMYKLKEAIWGNGQAKIKTHNIGTTYLNHSIKLLCLLSDNGFAAGDITQGLLHRSTEWNQNIGDLTKNTISIYVSTAGNNGWNIFQKNSATGTMAYPDFAKWAILWQVERGF